MSETQLVALSISNEAIRVLGVLIEKEKTTPDNYPLTLNSLISGCNQSTNRNPVVSYDEMTVERALTQLREVSLALRGVYAGSRVPKHRHNVEGVFNISDGALAVLAVLFLRGDQTLGELKQRTERLFDFKSLDECDKAVDELTSASPSLAKRLNRVPGQKENRIGHLFGDGKDADQDLDKVIRPAFQLIDGEKEDTDSDSDIFDADFELENRVDRLEKEVTVLTHEIMSLRAEIDSLRDPSA